MLKNYCEHIMKKNKTLFYLSLVFFGCQSCSFASEFEAQAADHISCENKSLISTTSIEKIEGEPFSFKDLVINELEENLTPSSVFMEARTVKTESDLKSLVNDIVMRNELTPIDFGILGKKAFELDSSFTMQRLHSFKANNQKNSDNSAMFAQIEWALLGLAVCYGKESFIEDIFSSFGSSFMASFDLDKNELLIKHFNPYFLSVKYKQQGMLDKLFTFRSDAPEKMKPMEYDGWFCDLFFYSIYQKNLDAFSFLISKLNEFPKSKDLFVSDEEMIELSWTVVAENFFGPANQVSSVFRCQLLDLWKKTEEIVEGKSANDPECIQYNALKQDLCQIYKILKAYF